MKLTLESEHEEINYVFDVNFTPGRPAPPCSDPDDPAFSDPGDGGEIEMLMAWRVDKKGNQWPVFNPLLLELKSNCDLLDRLYVKAEGVHQDE